MTESDGSIEWSGTLATVLAGTKMGKLGTKGGKNKKCSRATHVSTTRMGGW